MVPFYTKFYQNSVKPSRAILFTDRMINMQMLLKTQSQQGVSKRIIQFQEAIFFKVMDIEACVYLVHKSSVQASRVYLFLYGLGFCSG